MRKLTVKNGSVSRAGNALLILLVVIAGVAAGVWFFTSYGANGPKAGEEALIEMEDVDLDSMREQLREIQEVREAREAKEAAAAAKAIAAAEAEALSEADPSDQEDDIDEDTIDDGEIEEGDDLPVEPPPPPPAPVLPIYTGQLLAGSREVPYLSFNTADYQTAINANALILLHFYATWCPSCISEFPNITGAFDDLSAQGSTGVVGFRVNFNDSDTDKDEDALAQEFNVPYQHVKLLVRGGQIVTQSSFENWSRQRYLDEIQGAL